MVNFPSLTPSDFRWEAPTYEQVSHTAEDGAIVRQILMDTPGQGRVEVEFQNCKDSDFEAVLAAHDATYGQWDALTLPDAFWAGRGAALKAVINSYDARLEWAFAEVPAADWAKKGRCTIKVTLKHRVRPLALTLDPGGTATPLVPKVDPGTPAVVDALPVLNCNIVVPIPPDTIGCQDIWMSRMTTYTSNAQGKPAQAWKLLPDGTSYATFIWTDLGTTQMQYASLWLVLAKRDKDGNILWIRETASFKNYNWETTTNPTIIAIGNNGGVLLACRSSVRGTGTLDLCTRYWRVDANGNQLWEKLIYRMWGSSSSSYAPYDYGQYKSSSSEVYYFDEGNLSSTTYTLAINEATGTHRAVRYGSTNGTTGQRPMHWTVLASNGTIVGCGARDSKGRIFVIDPSTLGMTEEYIYTGSIGFEAILDYDASNYLVSETGRTKYHLVSKTNFDIVASWNIPAVPGVGDTSWLFCKAENGLVYHAGRSVEVSVGSGQYIAMTVMDVAAQVAVVKNYTTEFRLRVSSSSTQTAGVGPGGNGDYVVVSADVNMLLLAFSLSRSNTDQPQPDEDRVFVVSLGTKLPVGTYDFYPHAGAQHLIRVGVTATNTPFTSAVIPVKAVLAGYTPIATTPTNLTGEELAPFAVPVPADKHQFALVRDAVCPPKFWTSRLNVPLWAGSVSIETESYVDPVTSDVYTAFSYTAPNAADVGVKSLVVTKRDKDGALKWQKRTEDIYYAENGANFAWVKIPLGIALWSHRTVNGDGGSMWCFDLSTGAVVWQQGYAAGHACRLLIYDAGTNRIVGVDDSGDTLNALRIQTYDAATGLRLAHVRLTVGVTTGIRGFTQKTNGNFVVVGSRSSAGYLVEFTSALALVTQITYTGSTETFQGVAVAGNYLAVSGSAGSLFLLDVNNYTCAMAYKPASFASGTITANKFYIAADSNKVYLRWGSGGETYVYSPLDNTASLYSYLTRSYPTSADGSGVQTQTQFSISSNYQNHQHNYASFAGDGLSITAFSNNRVSGTSPNADTERLVITGSPTKLPQQNGTFTLNYRPGAEAYNAATKATLTLSVSTVALTTPVLPVPTAPISGSLADQGVQAPATVLGTFTDDTTITWDLQTYEFT